MSETIKSNLNSKADEVLGNLEWLAGLVRSIKSMSTPDESHIADLEAVNVRLLELVTMVRR
jgi:hypothetical protein